MKWHIKQDYDILHCSKHTKPLGQDVLKDYIVSPSVFLTGNNPVGENVCHKWGLDHILLG